MKLNAVTVQSAKWDGKDRKLADGHGLFLHVTKTGNYWRYRYRFGGFEKLYTFGPAKVFSLADARKLHLDARRYVLSGEDPMAIRKAEKAEKREVALRARAKATTVGDLKKEWIDHEADGWAPSHHAKVMLRLEKNLTDEFLSTPVSEVTPANVQLVLDVIQQRDRIDLAHRVRSYLKRMFDRAIRKRLIQSNPVLHPAVELKKKPEQTHYGHTHNKEKIGEILLAIDEYIGEPQVHSALQLLPLVFTRPGELRGARWTEFDLNQRLWEIPASRMKGKRSQLVPLSLQATTIMKKLQAVSGNDSLLFPGFVSRLKPISENTLNVAFRRLGFDKSIITSHGWRHIASTALNQREFVIGGTPTRFRHDAIERQLAHVPGGVRAVYNAAEYLPERIIIMQAWSDYLDELKTNTKTEV